MMNAAAPTAPPSEPTGSPWRADLPAAIVVFLVALPLCLGIALASNAPLFSGIIAGVVGGLVAGSISGSQLMVSGPAAGLTAIVVAAIATLGSYRAFLAAVVVGGLIQLCLAWFRAGIIGYYFPSSVIRGMLAAIGLTLILKQLPHAVGYDADTEGNLAFLQGNAENTFSALLHAAQRIEPAALLLSLTGLVVLVVWESTALKRIKLLPGPLVAVLSGVAGHWLLARFAPSLRLDPSHLVSLPVASTLGEFSALFAMPDWSALARIDTWRVAVTIGIVASLETLLSLEATDRLDPYKREAPSDRELAAQGVANVVSGCIGGLPVTGVIVRSSANVAAGAQTRRSTLLHGALLALSVVTMPALLNSIPLASLAAILLFTGYKLARPALFRSIWIQGRAQFIPFVTTIVAILLTDLLIGIGIGLGVGIFFILIDQIRYPPFTVVSPTGATGLQLKLQEQVSFLHKAALAQYLDTLPAGSRIDIDGSLCHHIDHDVLEFLSDFRQTAALKRIDLRFTGLELPEAALAH